MALAEKRSPICRSSVQNPPLKPIEFAFSKDQLLDEMLCRTEIAGNLMV